MGKRAVVTRGQISKLAIACAVLVLLIAGVLILGEKWSVNLSNVPSRSNSTSVGSENATPAGTPLGDVTPQSEHRAERESSDLFSGLKITDFQVKQESDSYCMTCSVQNENKVEVFGYFRVCFCDTNGKLMHEQIMWVDAVAAGASVSCSANISTTYYPEGYDSVKFVDAAIAESRAE